MLLDLEPMDHWAGLWLGHGVCETPKKYAESRYECDACFSWSKCSLFTLAAPRGPRPKRVRKFCSETSWIYFSLGALIHTSPHPQPIPLSVTRPPEHSFTTCLLADQSANQETRFLISPGIIPALHQQLLTTCRSNQHHLGAAKDPNMDEDPTLTEPMVWSRRRVGTEIAMTGIGSL